MAWQKVLRFAIWATWDFFFFLNPFGKWKSAHYWELHFPRSCKQLSELKGYPQSKTNQKITYILNTSWYVKEYLKM